MATVNELLLERASFEAELKDHLHGEALPRACVSAGMSLALVTVQHTLLELGVKGALPEGRIGAIMDEVKTALEDARVRVVGDLNG